MATAQGIHRRGLLAAGMASLLGGAGRAPDGLDAFVDGARREGAIPGLAVGYAEQGRVKLARGYGLADIATGRPVTAQTTFHIASITKTVTAAAIMQLVEAGRIDLDGPAAAHLDFPLVHPRHPQTPITFRHLLSHTSGISDARYYEIDFREKGRDAQLPLDALLRGYLVPGGAYYAADACFSGEPPGGAWDYSNIGYGLLGYLAGRIGGADMREAVARRIFAPLGMKRARWTLTAPAGTASVTPYDLVDGRPTPVEPVGMPDWAAGAIHASAADMARYVAACADGGGAMLTAGSMARMLDMQTPAKLAPWLSGQGLGWQASLLDGVARANHWGGDPGVFTAAYLDPERRRGVVVLTNTSVTPAARDAVKAIAARLLT